MDENRYSPSISAWYDRIMAAGYYDHNRVAEALAKILKNHQKILELGVGTGLLAQKLVTRGYNVSGIDFTKSMLEIAKKRLGKTTKLYYQNVIRLDLSEKFDAAISEGGIWPITIDREGTIFFESHITNLRQNIIGLRNVANCLSEGGLLLLGIQPIHSNLEGLELGGGAVYSQKVDYHLPWIDKEYFVKQNGNKLAYQQCRYRRFTEVERKKIIKEAGFIEVGFDKNKNFWIYKKH